MRIAILGTGRVARSIGGGLARAGHEVDFGSRGRSEAPELDGRVASVADAAAVGEVVINATPGATSLEMLKQIGAGPLAGKVLIDVANAIGPGFMLMYPTPVSGPRSSRPSPRPRSSRRSTRCMPA